MPSVVLLLACAPPPGGGATTGTTPATSTVDGLPATLEFIELSWAEFGLDSAGAVSGVTGAYAWVPPTVGFEFTFADADTDGVGERCHVVLDVSGVAQAVWVAEEGLIFGFEVPADAPATTDCGEHPATAPYAELLIAHARGLGFRVGIYPTGYYLALDGYLGVPDHLEPDGEGAADELPVTVTAVDPDSMALSYTTYQYGGCYPNSTQTYVYYEPLTWEQAVVDGALVPGFYTFEPGAWWEPVPRDVALPDTGAP